ncbi:hypothetical protein COU17_02545 [Candidatus Kaiserbacteria bacterium CG10_big_fil_rev_8_21_14_0_10_49_17]|uniref:MTTase N-terminal domain-containing protein n=1 Tax=Candidatus Kaiserbacteria bacterium CG10_big_fil_rev_8_21_14_0_10_49_17 TaxID=1974609 RepID=A0A2M6WE14_9BACT|nr:MAG: hypothetical protein COU17_02545 [Candidatus Kaiserbacteria bacterium CG10_big_fil_rev_8_21_14_0_10_49_17]
MANPLSSVLDSFSALFSGSKSGESVLGIDIGSSAIKVVQLRKRRGTAVLETYGELALGPYSQVDIGRATNLSAEQLSTALTDLIREANVTTRSVGVAVPFSASLITLIQMPNLPRKQLAEMIPIEARKYIPVPISEVTLDWFIVPQDESKFLSHEEKEKAQASNKVDVLVVAIHNEVLGKYQDVMERAGLSVSFYEIEIFSAIRAAIGQGVAPAMVIDMGAASTKVYLVEYGVVKSSHIINRGAQDVTFGLSKSTGISVTKAEELKRTEGLVRTDGQTTQSILLTLEYIFSEANRVLLNYQKRFNKNIGQVVLTGGGAAMKGLEEYAARHFETEVVLADPFAKVESPAFLEEVLEEVGPEFSVAVGVALRKLHEQG